MISCVKWIAILGTARGYSVERLVKEKVSEWHDRMRACVCFKLRTIWGKWAALPI